MVPNTSEQSSQGSEESDDRSDGNSDNEMSQASSGSSGRSESINSQNTPPVDDRNVDSVNLAQNNGQVPPNNNRDVITPPPSPVIEEPARHMLEVNNQPEGDIGSNIEDDNNSREQEQPQEERRHSQRYNLRPQWRCDYAQFNDRGYTTFLHNIMRNASRPFGYLFKMEQMFIDKGLKRFGKSGAEAVLQELRQVDYCRCVWPCKASSLTKEEKQRALRYLMYLKQK